MPLKRIRYQHSSLDTKLLKQGESYNKLLEIISLIYTTDPIPNHDTGDTLNDFALVDLKNSKIAYDYGIRILVVNAKYKDKEFKEFSDVIEDLQKENADDIKNLVIKDIHLRTKQTKKGKIMYSDWFKKNYGDKIDQLQKELNEANNLIQDKDEQLEEVNNLIQDKDDQLEEANEEIKKYKKFIEENGLVFE